MPTIRYPVDWDHKLRGTQREEAKKKLLQNAGVASSDRPASQKPKIHPDILKLPSYVKNLADDVKVIAYPSELFLSFGAIGYDGDSEFAQYFSYGIGLDSKIRWRDGAFTFRTSPYRYSVFERNKKITLERIVDKELEYESLHSGVVILSQIPKEYYSTVISALSKKPANFLNEFLSGKP